MNIELTTWQYCSIMNFARFCIKDTKLTFSFTWEYRICYNLCRAKKNIIDKRKYVIYGYFYFIRCYNYKLWIWSRYIYSTYFNKFKMNFLSLLFHKKCTFLFIKTKLLNGVKTSFMILLCNVFSVTYRFYSLLGIGSISQKQWYELIHQKYS